MQNKTVAVEEPVVKEPEKKEPTKKKFEKKPEIMVMCRTCYLREYPSVTSQRVLMFPMLASGQEVEVISRTKNEENWCKVKVEGVTGYCKEKYLTPKRA